MKFTTIESNPLLKLTFEFSLAIVEYCDSLEQLRKYVIAKQLLNAGTSIGANCFEAQNAESKADFVHKLKIASKETGETLYWLNLCKYSRNYPNCDALLEKARQINLLLGKIISTARRNAI